MLRAPRCGQSGQGSRQPGGTGWHLTGHRMFECGHNRLALHAAWLGHGGASHAGGLAVAFSGSAVRGGCCRCRLAGRGWGSLTPLVAAASGRTGEQQQQQAPCVYGPCMTLPSARGRCSRHAAMAELNEEASVEPHPPWPSSSSSSLLLRSKNADDGICLSLISSRKHYAANIRIGTYVLEGPASLPGRPRWMTGDEHE